MAINTETKPINPANTINKINNNLELKPTVRCESEGSETTLVLL